MNRQFPSMTDQQRKDYDISCKIRQRRLQVLVHSYIYYERNMNLVSDSDFDRWEHELVELQNRYPENSRKEIFAEAFEKFDGNSGAFLPYQDPMIVNIAERLILNTKP